MGLKHLDHVNLRTTRLQEMRAFYCNALGLREGARPPFSFRGAWLYCGDRPVVHLVEVAERQGPVTGLSLEHFAFAADGLADFLQGLGTLGIEYRVSHAPGLGLQQINVTDPDGNHIHIDFSAEERT